MTVTTQNRLPETDEAFMTWLRNVSPRRQFYPLLPCACPRAQFLAAQGPKGEKIYVGGYDYQVGETDFLTFPPWAERVFKVATDLSRGKEPRRTTAAQLYRTLSSSTT